MAKVSWIILTFDRAEIVRQAIGHCLDNSGAPEAIGEIVWIDNGSSDGVRDVMRSFEPEISVLYSENTGVARGYNTGLGLAREEYVVITGCDCLMPDNWLKIMLEYVTKIPETGIASIYTKHWTYKQERLRKQFGIDHSYALPIVHAMPIERRIFRRELLKEIGYFPETLGKYGWDDLCWARRAEQVCDDKGLLYYVIPELIAIHLGTEGIAAADGKDDSSYHAMKRQEVQNPEKQIEMARLKELGWPRFTPFP